MGSSFRPVLVAPVVHLLAGRLIQMQTEFATPPQHIVSAARPLVLVQIMQFGLEQAGGHLLAQITGLQEGLQP